MLLSSASTTFVSLISVEFAMQTRIGVTQGYVEMFSRLGASWIERNASKIVHGLADALNSPKVRHYHAHLATSKPDTTLLCVIQFALFDGYSHARSLPGTGSNRGNVSRLSF